jgi:serine/threonine protein phosphatase PrpC
VVRVTDSEALLAVIDGLGHGPEAAAAAEQAVEVLRENPGEPVEVLLLLCHTALARTRGAAVTVASIRATNGSMSWLGVGNVEAVLLRGVPSGNAPGDSSTEWALLHGGIVGYQLPTLRPRLVDLQPGDVLMMATDGIARTFAEDASVVAGPARLADRILENLARPNDDALVLVARYGTERS